MIIINYILKSLLIINTAQVVLSQSILNPSKSKKIIFERNSFFSKNHENAKNKEFNLIYNAYSYFNSNLPNLENNNGLYLPKGYGIGSSYLAFYENENIYLSMEPEIHRIIRYPINIPLKESYFSKLNDIPLDKSILSMRRVKNTGIKLKYKKTSIGYGNWDQWWGPGIHNSLVLSNNTKSFKYLFFNNASQINDNLSYKANLFVSDPMKNPQNDDFFLSAFSLIINYKNIEIGRSKHVLSGGYKNIPWSMKKALLVPLFNEKNKYWDNVIDYYLSIAFPASKLKIFFELGIPNRSFSEIGGSLLFPDHSTASIIGFRKYGIFDLEKLLLGFEYTSTLISQYYYKMPSYNWYGSYRYNFSSYLGRRWGAHSGTDSDDFLVLLGYLSNTFGLIYEINYERHGVIYNFPPEVKLESRVAINYRHKNLFLNILYENEFFEHYGFVDNSNDVWGQTYQEGSVQRTNTLILTLEFILR